MTSYQLAIASGAVLGGLLVDYSGPGGPVIYCAIGSFLGCLAVLISARNSDKVRSDGG